MPAYINEIFNSIQGEGPYAGMRQVFVRFGQCQLHCSYCDAKEARNISGSCRIESNPGEGDFVPIKNPMQKTKVEDIIRQLWTPSTKHISFTGGEPLLNSNFIRTLDVEYPMYLETNAGLPEQAQELKDIITIASCDIKLPEHGCTDNYNDLLRKEIETISIFNEYAITFVKVIILPETTKRSLSLAVDAVVSIDRDIPFILQPVTSRNKISPGLLFELMDYACAKLKDVRVIPQLHTLLNIP